MKTLEQIVDQYKSKTIDGRDLHRLMVFIPEDMLPKIGIKLKPEYVGTHKAVELTREKVIEYLEGDVRFGFEKALYKRGISASLMFSVVSMWNWILEEGLEDFEEYTHYGLPLFKATAIKYGFNNPIGDNTGSEDEYSSD